MWELAPNVQKLAKSWYVVARNFFLLLLEFSAWPCLGPASQDLQTLPGLCTSLKKHYYYSFLVVHILQLTDTSGVERLSSSAGNLEELIVVTMGRMIYWIVSGQASR